MNNHSLFTPLFAKLPRIQRARPNSSAPRCTALVLGAYLLISTPLAHAEEGDAQGVDGIGQTLLDAREVGTSTSKLAANLIRKRGVGIPELFETLRRSRFDVRIGENGNSTKKLTKTERNALITALGLLPWSDVDTYLDDLRADEIQESQRLTAIRVLGSLGTADEFWDLLRWSEVADSKTRVPRSIQGAFELSLETMLGRIPGGLRKMPSLYSAANLSLVPAIVRTLGKSESEESLNTLAKMLGKIPDADALLLAEISSLGAVVSHPINFRTRDHVRHYLGNHDGSLQVEGILACSMLGDTDAVPRLIELLTDKNTNVRVHALKALKEITTQFYSYNPEDWSEWYEKTNRWHSERAPDLLNDIATGSTSVSSRAVLECSKQRFFRHELAPVIAQCLTRPNEELVILTCATLGHLASPLTVPDLVRSLDHASTNVRRAAMLALRRVTGEDHGEDSRDWVSAGW